LRQLIQQDLVDLQHLLDLVDRRLQQRQLNLLLRQDLEDRLRRQGRLHL
jgi:hypothetical protein